MKINFQIVYFMTHMSSTNEQFLMTGLLILLLYKLTFVFVIKGFKHRLFLTRPMPGLLNLLLSRKLVCVHLCVCVCVCVCVCMCVCVCVHLPPGY